MSHRTFADLLAEDADLTEHEGIGESVAEKCQELVATGKLIFRETIADGLSAAPEAFLGLLRGKNFGKQLVKLI